MGDGWLAEVKNISHTNAREDYEYSRTMHRKPNGERGISMSRGDAATKVASPLLIEIVFSHAKVIVREAS